MPIEIRYAPSPAAAGRMAYETGVGLRGMEDAQRQEQIRQFEQQQKEQARQFNQQAAQQLYGVERNVAAQQWSQLAANNIWQQQAARQQQYNLQNQGMAQQYGLEQMGVGALLGQQQALTQDVLQRGQMGYGSELGQQQMAYQAALNEVGAQQGWERAYPAAGTEEFARMQAGPEAAQQREAEMFKITNPRPGDPEWANFLLASDVMQKQVIKNKMTALSDEDAQWLLEVGQAVKNKQMTAAQMNGAILARLGTPASLIGPTVEGPRKEFKTETGSFWELYDSDGNLIPGQSQYIPNEEPTIRGNIMVWRDKDGVIQHEKIDLSPQEVKIQQQKYAADIYSDSLGIYSKMVGPTTDPEKFFTPQNAEQAAFDATNRMLVAMGMEPLRTTPLPPPPARAEGPAGGLARTPDGGLARTEAGGLTWERNPGIRAEAAGMPPGAAVPVGRITIRRTSDGLMGTIPATTPIPAGWERVG